MPGIAICNSPILSSGATPPFVVSDTPGTLLWLGSYDPANATLHTQPLNIDARGTFDADSGWTKGTGWSIGSGVATFNTPTTGAYLTSTGTACIIGCRYSAQFDVARRVVGSFRLDMGGVSGTNRSAVGTYVEEVTATSTTALRVLGAGGGTEGDIDNVKSFTNKSIRYYVPKYRAAGLTGKLGQATDEYMPYTKEDGIVFDMDSLSWDGAITDFKCFTDGSGATVISCITLDHGLYNGSNRILRVGTNSTSTVGCALEQYQDGLYLVISNGTSSRFIQTVSHTWDVGSTYVITMRVASGTNGVACRVNKVSKITGTLDTFSSANPTTTKLLIGQGGCRHTRKDLYIANRVLTDAEVEAIEDDMYFRATGGTL